MRSFFIFHPDCWTFCKNATMPVCYKYFIKHQVPSALQVHCTCVDVYSFFFFTFLGFGCRSNSRSHWSCWVFFPSLVYHKVMCSLYYFAVHEIWVNRYPPPIFLFLPLQPASTTLGWGLRTTAPLHPGDSSSQEGFHNCHLSFYFPVCLCQYMHKQTRLLPGISPLPPPVPPSSSSVAFCPYMSRVLLQSQEEAV